jgi:tetratricopeptide (TPR) repeat protein
MQRPWVLAKRLLTAISIVLILIALAIWTIRPSPFYEWLGAEGLINIGTPLSVLRDWADGGHAPMTPFGFLTLFPRSDLFILAALVAALGILLVLLPSQWRDLPGLSWLSMPIRLFRVPRLGMRVGTTMILIAILGLDLGWENVAWRNWRLRERYLRQASGYGSSEGQWMGAMRQAESRLARLEAETSVAPEEASWTPAARAAEKAYSRDQWRRDSANAASQAAYFAELRRKYERAATELSRTVPPDPPRPIDHGQIQPEYWMRPGSGARDLARYEELIRLYPDLPWVHRERAFILATCPDARIRDGKRAVSAATRAAELTNWKDWDVLMTLAAAYAEAGDFANAVRWEQRVVEVEQAFRKQLPPSLVGTMAPQVDRLALYKAGKPYRMGP